MEICGLKDGKWLRLTAEAVADGRVEARCAMLTQNPNLRGMYKEDDGISDVLNAIMAVKEDKVAARIIIVMGMKA